MKKAEHVLGEVVVGSRKSQHRKSPADHAPPQQDPHGDQQHDTQHRSLWQAVVETYLSPDAWGRPDDRKKTLPDQWKLHTSNWRFLNALLPYLGPPTNTLAHIWLPVLSVLTLCVLIKLVDGHIAWKLDQHNYALTLFRSSSFVLSLLLAFRLNRSYDRWWQARSAFGGIGGGIVNIVRQVATYTDDAELIRRYQKWGMCMVYGIVQLINNTPKQTDPRVETLLDAEELTLYNSTTKPSKLCGSILSTLTASAGFDIMREMYINEMLGSVAANISQIARIKLQAMPFGVSLFCTGWTYIWLLVLPFGLFPEGSWWGLLPVAVMATMMLGLEDLAVQTEDPFKFFAYEAMIATTAKDMPRTVAEVQACKAMMQHKYNEAFCPSRALRESSPWPVLPPQPQRA